MDQFHLEQISITHRETTVQWLVPERVIFVSNPSHIVPAQLAWMSVRILNLVHSCSTSQIHLINDMSRIQHVSLSSLSHRAHVLRHPRIGWFVSVGTPPCRTASIIAELFVRFISSRCRHTPTLDTALTTLQTLDPTLPDLSTACHPLAKV